MSSVNKVIIIGNLGQAPDLREFSDGGKICTMSIATSETWRDKSNGEKKERTEWHRVVVKNQKVAENCANYLRKGSKVYIEGQLQTRKWQDQSGQDRYSTEVVVAPYKGDVTFLSAVERQDTQGDHGYSAPPPGDLDDEIPF